MVATENHGSEYLMCTTAFIGTTRQLVSMSMNSPNICCPSACSNRTAVGRLCLQTLMHIYILLFL